MLRRRRRRAATPTIDLSTFDARWRAPIEEVVASQQRFRAMLEECEAGPTEERMRSLAERIDNGVLVSITIATRAQTAARTVREMDLDTVQQRLKSARRRVVDARERGDDPASSEHEVEILMQQHAALNDLRNMVDDAAERLRLLDLRLDAAVARAAQLLLRPAAVGAAEAVEVELSSVLDELDALRAGFAAVDSAPPPR
jgi:hypothetical protein